VGCVCDLKILRSRRNETTMNSSTPVPSPRTSYSNDNIPFWETRPPDDSLRYQNHATIPFITTSPSRLNYIYLFFVLKQFWTRFSHSTRLIRVCKRLQKNRILFAAHLCLCMCVRYDRTGFSRRATSYFANGMCVLPQLSVFSLYTHGRN
jgi:hypothetical protein